MSLNLDDFLSTELSLSSTSSTTTSGVAFGYGAYRLGGGSAPLVLRATITAVAADPRAALQAVVSQHPAFFEPAVAAARTIVSGTGWYSKCGPAVGGCDVMGSNQTLQAVLEEIGFKWVWNNNFAEYVVVVPSLEAVLARGVMEEHACCVSQHALTFIIPLGWLRASPVC
jgi:hypothetical protein